jgi:hypothetical protein
MPSERNRPPPRDRKVQPGPLVLAVLLITCIGMMAAIYWVVRTGKL